MEDRDSLDEDEDNEVVLVDKCLPEEVIAQILINVDCDTLLNCQLVCSRWKTLIQEYVWRKKAEDVMSHSLHCIEDVHWTVYYAICKWQPFKKNLVKNCSGQNGAKEHWQIIPNGQNTWKVESPPKGVQPLPPGVWPFKGKVSCFVTSDPECSKKQMIDLASAGLTSRLLDTLQPPIVVSEWYSCRFDCDAIYECCVQLLNNNGTIMKTFEHRVLITGEANKWHHVSHVFEDYGPGLKKIIFRHAGVSENFTASHFGNKMTCASVRVNIPEGRKTRTQLSMAEVGRK